GVGGGIVLDGRLLDGAAGNAGHVGHVIVEPDGRRCGCGARGCLEAEASGTAIAAIIGRPPAEAPPEIVIRAGRAVGRAVASVAAAPGPRPGLPPVPPPDRLRRPRPAAPTGRPRQLPVVVPNVPEGSPPGEVA